MERPSTAMAGYRPTRRDPHAVLARRAFRFLEEARELRRSRVQILKMAFAHYGDQGAIISGCERDHFPDSLKDLLRSNARLIAARTDLAVEFWQKAGRRMSTLRPFLEGALVEGCRY